MRAKESLEVSWLILLNNRHLLYKLFQEDPKKNPLIFLSVSGPIQMFQSPRVFYMSCQETHSGCSMLITHFQVQVDLTSIGIMVHKDRELKPSSPHCFPEHEMALGSHYLPCWGNLHVVHPQQGKNTPLWSFWIRKIVWVESLKLNQAHPCCWKIYFWAQNFHSTSVDRTHGGYTRALMCESVLREAIKISILFGYSTNYIWASENHFLF